MSTAAPPSQLRAIEQRLDDEYGALFPSATWEEGVAHLLLAYELELVGDRLNGGFSALTEDTYKYALMHAMRWGAEATSNPSWSFETGAQDQVLDRARSAVLRASEYDRISVAFTSHSRGLWPVTQISDDSLTFGYNERQLAYDVLEYQQRPPIVLLPEKAHFAKVFRELNCAPIRRGSLSFSWSTATLPPLRTALRGFERRVYRLPEAWSFRGITIEEFRRFWDALKLLTFLHHSALGPRSLGERRWRSLLIWSEEEWVANLASLAELPLSMARQILEFHIYDRHQQRPDVALTPLFRMGRGLIVASPGLIQSSSLERNLYAQLARRHKSEIDNASGILAPAMAAELAADFEKIGVRASPGVSISTSLGDSDVDLLLWSERSGRLISAELKWFVEVADVGEVFAKEAKCQESLTRQLPKHTAAIREDPVGLLRKGFRVHRAPRVKASSSILISRGFSGAARLEAFGYPIVPENTLVQKIAGGLSLRDLSAWANARRFVPRKGVDFAIADETFASPSGILITTSGFNVDSVQC